MTNSLRFMRRSREKGIMGSYLNIHSKITVNRPHHLTPATDITSRPHPPRIDRIPYRVYPQRKHYVDPRM